MQGAPRVGCPGEKVESLTPLLSVHYQDDTLSGAGQAVSENLLFCTKALYVHAAGFSGTVAAKASPGPGKKLDVCRSL